ncbi:MAG TPA: DUF2497 domain-containing protein [Caulobacteraceae bacterium]
MSDQTAPEPTMEEILASIRRIISEDDAPPEADADDARLDEDGALEDAEAFAEDMAAAPEDTAEAEPEPDPEPEPAASAADPEPAPEPEHRSAPPPRPIHRDEPLVGRIAESASVAAFRELSAATSPAGKGRTLEDLAREMLQPMLREWLDQNLPRIVEAAVRDEVERISRSRVG